MTKQPGDTIVTSKGETVYAIRNDSGCRSIELGINCALRSYSHHEFCITAKCGNCIFVDYNTFILHRLTY